MKFLSGMKIMKEDDAKLINVHSSAIHIENKVGLKARLAWFYMLYKAFPVLNSQNSFEISIGDLKKAIGYTSKNNGALKSSLTELARTEIQWNIFNKDGHEWGISHLLSECRIKTDSNIIYYEYSSFVKEKLSNPEMYVKINLLVSKTFKSKHSLSLYCLALDYLFIKNNYGEKNISLEDMRRYLGLEDHEYTKPGDLYIHILKKAGKEINSNSDLNLKIEPFRGERLKIMGFKFQMSIKEEFLESYRPQKLITQKNNDDKQTNLFDSVEVSETKEIKVFKEKKELIKVTNQELKKYFAENKISMTTDTVQNKLKEIQETFQENFEDYLIFLMNYTNQEAKKRSINNLSGFYVGLLKEDSQLDNYIIFFQQQQQIKENKQIKVKSMIENELQKQYAKYLSEGFDNYLVENIDKLENKVIKIIESTLKPGDFILDVIIARSHKGIIDKTLITDSKPSTRAGILGHLKNYKDELNYKIISFDKWKNKEITEEVLDEIENKIIKSF